jgi:UPF0716 protein FxsA
MGWVLLLIFVGLPLAELTVLIEVGSDIGAIPTIALCLLTAFVGLFLIRLQGLKVIADIQRASLSGQPLVAPMVHGFFLLIAGACLFFPGFLTDAVGGLLLIPPVRIMLGKLGLAHAAAARSQSFYRREPNTSDETVIVEGEYWAPSGTPPSYDAKTIEGEIDDKKSSKPEKTQPNSGSKD